MKTSSVPSTTKADSRERAKSAGGSALSPKRRGAVLTKGDGIYSFVGIATSKIPGGISTKKHAYCK